MRLDPLVGKINIPYKWKLMDQKVIIAYPVTSHLDWSLLNYRHKTIKERIKAHYSIQQNDHCVYCRLPLNFKGWDEPIEHIIHKEFKHEYMFLPLNLALSCRHCNTKKSTNHALTKAHRNMNIFPNQSTHYRIIHPHFDNFDDYIILEDNLFYRAVNKDKGYLHIIFFSLNEEVVLMARARALAISHLDYYKKLIHKISDPDIPRREKRHYRELANSIIERRQL